MELSNSIIDKVCSDTKFKYDGNYFIYNAPCNCDESNINFQIKSKICDIKDNGSLYAKIFVTGFESDWQKRFQNLNDYISYLSEKSLALDYKIKTDLEDFLNNLFDGEIVFVSEIL